MGFGGQTKPVFHKKVKFHFPHSHFFFALPSRALSLICRCRYLMSLSTLIKYIYRDLYSLFEPNHQAKTTKKITLRLECKECKTRSHHQMKRCKSFELGEKKKTVSKF